LAIFAGMICSLAHGDVETAILPKAQPAITVRVNSQKQNISGRSGSYVALDREWHDGDRVEIQLPMKLHTGWLPGTTNTVALLYGPIVLAGELGTNGMPNPYARDQTAFTRLPVPQVPVFVADSVSSLLGQIKATDQPLVFCTKHLGHPTDVTLIPLYRLHHERYSVYWNLLSESDRKNQSPSSNN
jgi:DUF1680 family protein